MSFYYTKIFLHVFFLILRASWDIIYSTKKYKYGYIYGHSLKYAYIIWNFSHFKDPALLLHHGSMVTHVVQGLISPESVASRAQGGY